MQPSGLVMSWFVVSLYLVHVRFTDAWQHSTGYVFCRVRWPVSRKGYISETEKMSSHCSQFTVAQHTVQPRRRKHRVVSNDFGSGACQKPAHHYQMIKQQANPICGNASLRSLMDFPVWKGHQMFASGEERKSLWWNKWLETWNMAFKKQKPFFIHRFLVFIFPFSASKSNCLDMINKMLAFTC